MRRFLAALVSAAIIITTTPETWFSLSPEFSTAEAQKVRAGRGGGGKGYRSAQPRRGSGAKSRPATRNRSQRGSGRPSAGQLPSGGWNPGNRPPATRPPPDNSPPGIRPPPGNRPPGSRPPGYHPPGYRPPQYRPPHYRPPHYRWGRYYYYPSWGWYFTATPATATLLYVVTLPPDCVKVIEDGEDMYLCNNVYYRPTYYDGALVYLIVDD
jgi:hypothetical protein